MNVERIKKVQAHIAETVHLVDSCAPHANNFFNMNRYSFRVKGSACGTPACIAGWAYHFRELDAGRKARNSPRIKPSEFHLVPRHASDWMDLNFRWALLNLFEPLNLDLDSLTPARAVLALQRILDAGEDHINLTWRELWKEEKSNEQG